MYLLTYEYAKRTNDGDVWLPILTFAAEVRSFEVISTLRVRNVELFERRGNDWIRIRPEEEPGLPSASRCTGGHRCWAKGASDGH